MTNCPHVCFFLPSKQGRLSGLHIQQENSMFFWVILIGRKANKHPPPTYSLFLMTVNNGNNLPCGHDANMCPHSTITHTLPVTKTRAWLKWKGLGPGAQLNCLYKPRNKYCMSGDLTRAHQLHTSLGIPSELPIHLSLSPPLHPSPERRRSISCVMSFVMW